ncbi:MAG TPA: hypothetical protein VD973_03575 [Symbiobacteriaceae bacterium]|nr:hypothetical protein [Symbiobacteriaceae bacterium]
MREINPVVDAIARGESAACGPALRLAVALGLVTPESGLTEAGRAYARPALPAGPSSLVMTPERRDVGQTLVGGPLPLQASLRRLLRLVIAQREPLVAPSVLGWPEALLRPYLAYLEDLGLLVPIGPLVEVTSRGRLVAALSDRPAVWEPLDTAEASADGVPYLSSAVFRYYLVRRVCMVLIARRGRREWHLLQPLLDGPLAPLAPAYTEWLGRFLAAQPAGRRSWPAELVWEYEAGLPGAPAWFGAWCEALLGAGPERALDVLVAAAGGVGPASGAAAPGAPAAADTPGLLREPAVLTGEPLSRETWLMATAIGRASQQGWALRYAEASARLAQDGVALPPWPAMHGALEAAGLMVTREPEVRLVLPVQVRPPADAIWPYASPEWLLAALLEGHAFTLPGPGRRPGRRILLPM